MFHSQGRSPRRRARVRASRVTPDRLLDPIPVVQHVPERPVPARARGGSLAGVAGDRVVPRHRRPVVLPAGGRAFRALSSTPRRSGGSWSTCASRPRPSWPASRSPGRCRSTPATASSSGSRMARGCSSARPARSRWSGSTRRRPRRRRARRCSWPANGWSRGHDRGRGSESGRRVEKPWGHELIWAHTDRYVGKILVIEAGRRLSLQRHLVKDELILVSSGRLRLHLEDDEGTIASRSSGRASTATCRPGGSIATRRSSAAR